MRDGSKIIPTHLRLKGSKLAYYLKKKYPELYQRVREVRDRYGVAWDATVASRCSVVFATPGNIEVYLPLV